MLKFKNFCSIRQEYVHSATDLQIQMNFYKTIVLSQPIVKFQIIDSKKILDWKKRMTHIPMWNNW